VITFVIGVGFAFYVDSLKQGYETYAIFPSGQKIKILDILRTDEERSRGLSGRDAIAANEGMYFTFPEEDAYGFWMKDMRFPIDIIWISKGKIFDITKNALPEPGVSDGALKVYVSQGPIGTVLEMTAGAEKMYNLKVGDAIQIRIIPKK
jgi:uncharacterized membrane protein (UPF0127 family)